MSTGKLRGFSSSTSWDCSYSLEHERFYHLAMKGKNKIQIDMDYDEKPANIQNAVNERTPNRD